MNKDEIEKRFLAVPRYVSASLYLDMKNKETYHLNVKLTKDPCSQDIIGRVKRFKRFRRPRPITMCVIAPGFRCDPQVHQFEICPANENFHLNFRLTKEREVKRSDTCMIHMLRNTDLVWTGTLNFPSIRAVMQNEPGIIIVRKSLAGRENRKGEKWKNIR